MSQQGLVVFAKNKKRVSAFYQQTLDLDLAETGTSHDLLRGHGYEVVVHTIPRKYSASSKRFGQLRRPLAAISNLISARGTFEAMLSSTDGIQRGKSYSLSGRSRRSSPSHLPLQEL